MTGPDLIWTLAFDYTEIVVVALGVIIMVGSWVANWIKQSADKRKAEQRAAQRRNQAGQSGGDLDDLAARRREQLQQMARQRQQQQPGGAAQMRAGAPPTEPANLTMAERIARARAKAQYEQRAGGQQQQQAAQQQQQADRAEQLRRAREQETLRQRQQQQRLEQQRARQQAEARAEQVRRQRIQRARQQQQRRAAAPRRRQPLPTMEVLPEHEPIDAGESIVHRHVTDAPTTEVTHAHPAAVAPVSVKQMNLSAWRRAIVLKEILDRPVALRDDDASNAIS